MEKYAGHEKVLMFPPSVEEWVGRDHPARFIREFVNSIDLRRYGFRERKSDEGRPNYSIEMLLMVWIYGYMNRIRSSRELEKACREHLSLIWLTGNQAPDHNTLWRFWDRNRKAIGKIFRESVSVGYRIGCIGFVLHAIDGTKITARSGANKALHRRDLDKQLESLEQELTRLEAAIAAGESETGEYRLPEQYANGRALREAIRGALEKLDRAGTDHLQPNEPSARMVKNHGRKEFGYNGQVVVDDQSEMIVETALVQDEFDQRQLIPMLDQVQRQWGRTADETVADGGYNTADAIAEAEANGYPVTLAAGPADEESHPDEAYHPSRFRLDAERNVVICPRGEELRFERIKPKGDGREAALYRCNAFRTCPVRELCTRSKTKGRSIEIGRHHDAVMRQKLKRRTPEGRARIRRRATLAERPFAVIKHILNFRRAAAAGIEKVRSEWSFICAIHNLRILLGYWQTARLAL